MTTVPNLNPIPVVTGDDLLISHDIATNRSGRISAAVLKTFISDQILADGDITASDIPYDGSTVETQLNRSVKTIPNFTGISTALPAMQIGQQFSLAYHTAPKYGGGIFDVVDPTGLTADSGITVINGGKAAIRQLNGPPTPVMYGAIPDGISPARGAFNAVCSRYNSIRVPSGTYSIDSQKLGEYQKPLNVVGDGADVILKIAANNVDNKVFRVGAVGGPFGGYTQERVVTKFKNLTFMPPTGVTAPYSYTGIDIQAVFPITLEDIVMLGMGSDSLKILSCFYGYVNGLLLVNSGLTLSDVNVLEFSGGEVRSDNATSDPTGGAALFSSVGKYPVSLLESDLIKFTGTVFEGWKCPVINLVRSYNTIFNGSWFEANESSSYVIKMEQAQTVEFNSCQLDFAIPYSDCFIKVDNQIPNSDENRYWTSFIRIAGGYLLCTSVSFGDAKEFVKVTSGEEVNVSIDNVTFRGGPLYADKSVKFDVKGILINGESKHSFYSIPNAVMVGARNSWMPKSLSTDWDFSLGANFTATAGLVVATTTTPGEFLTGTRAVKVSSIPNDGAQKTVARLTTTDMGPVTTNGQCYLIFIRVRCDKDVTFRCEIDGGFADFGQTPTGNTLPANEWRDYVVKTDAATTWAQGRFSAPTVKMYITNPIVNGSAATLFIDRVDYSIVRGDVKI